MNDDRRYGEDDIRQIFERAGSTEGATQRTDISFEGLTLAELQVIAEEVGLSPARIAEAAATLHVPSAAERRNRLGMPVSVSRTALLARLPTDYEWELLLAELRSTFGVLGRDRSKGNIREWTDGTLFALTFSFRRAFAVARALPQLNVGHSVTLSDIHRRNANGIGIAAPRLWPLVGSMGG